MKRNDPLKKWAEQWSETGNALDRVKQSELQHIHVERAILQLEDAFQIALQNKNAPPWSGLIEMQKWFGRLNP